MGHAGGQAHQHRNAESLREVERRADHVVGLLLRRGLEDGDQREFAVEARVLFVLRRVHRGVVGRHDDQTAVGAGHRRVDEGVGGDVHADMLHADQGALAGKRHAERLLHGGLLVGRPRAVDAAFGRKRVSLNVLRDFRGGRARVGVDARKSGVESPQREGFISQ